MSREPKRQPNRGNPSTLKEKIHDSVTILDVWQACKKLLEEVRAVGALLKVATEEQKSCVDDDEVEEKLVQDEFLDPAATRENSENIIVIAVVGNADRIRDQVAQAPYKEALYHLYFGALKFGQTGASGKLPNVSITFRARQAHIRCVFDRGKVK